MSGAKVSPHVATAGDTAKPVTARPVATVATVASLPSVNAIRLFGTTPSEYAPRDDRGNVRFVLRRCSTLMDLLEVYEEAGRSVGLPDDALRRNKRALALHLDCWRMADRLAAVRSFLADWWSHDERTAWARLVERQPP